MALKKGGDREIHGAATLEHLAGIAQSTRYVDAPQSMLIFSLDLQGWIYRPESTAGLDSEKDE
jgi:hypothetical protein